MVEENNIAANDVEGNDNMNGGENHLQNNNQGGMAIQQQQHNYPETAHEIPTSDQEDHPNHHPGGSSSSSYVMEHGNADYGYEYHSHPHHNMMSGGGPATNGLLPSPSSFYNPPPPHFPPHLPPILPPPPSSSQNNNNEQTQLEYYEARMREHAMQYANAAAGAAWAAARMANHSWSLMQQQQQQQMESGGEGGAAGRSFHFDNLGGPPPMNNSLMMNNSHPSQQQQASFHPEFHLMQQQQQQYAPQLTQQQRRKKLWKPPKEDENVKSKKKLKYPTTNDGQEAPRINIQQQPSSSKKRECGNDSVSSLGSESYHHKQQQQQHQSGSNSNKKKKKNQRPKRELQHQQQQQNGLSSKSSFSSMGSSNNTNTNNNNRKKKNRSNNNNSSNNNNIQGIFLGGLIGKTGVSALHELCHKYRWERPVYTLIENVASSSAGDGCDNVGGGDNGNGDVGEVPEGTTDTNTNNQYHVHPHEFVISVHVNKIELGRGRGDSKTAAKQDASRKALGALVPGVVFDPNGILLDMGGGGGGGGRTSSSRSSGGDCVITSMEELGPHLASQLAIGGGNTATATTGNGGVALRSRPSSPDHSETSSISTSVSMTKNNVGIGEGCGGVISCGPVSGFIGARYSSNIYPCASTTSGVSSASEVEDGEDENAYYASRGASVCSTLLQAMWQIDDRIRQPPSHVFDVYPVPSAKDSGSGIEQPNKRRKSGGSAAAETKKPAAHRGTFQCTATLNLYFRIDEEGKEYSPASLMESWVSPLEYLQSKDKTYSSSYYGDVVSSQESRKRKDSFASQATPSPDRRLKGDVSDEPDYSTSKRQKVDEFMKHTLECKATGSTKRESKHKASAKLLTLLFPECSSLVEVKAAAEAARECYAATKAMSSQTKRAKLSDKGSPEKRGPAAERSGNILAKSESFVSVAGLSLSEEPADESKKRIKWCDSTETEPIAGLDASFECEVDAALKSLRDQEEEPSDDVGRIVLCRAQPDDAEFIHALLNKACESQRCEEITNVHTSNGEDDTNPLHGSESIYLLLSRAVASHEPLGCAILTFVSSSIEGGRSLLLQNIGHEEHLPKERFIECLESFASKLETNLDTSSIFNDVRLLSPDEIRKCLSRSKIASASLPPSYQGEEVISMNMKGSSSHSLLQSVKEEDSEDADDGSDGDNVNVEKEIDNRRAQHDPEASGKRPMRSKRRREMHDQQQQDL